VHRGLVKNGPGTGTLAQLRESNGNLSNNNDDLLPVGTFYPPEKSDNALKHNFKTKYRTPDLDCKKMEN